MRPIIIHQELSSSPIASAKQIIQGTEGLNRGIWTKAENQFNFTPSPHLALPTNSLVGFRSVAGPRGFEVNEMYLELDVSPSIYHPRASELSLVQVLTSADLIPLKNYRHED